MSSMKSSSAKKASITLPAELDKRLRKLAKKEHRTLSGVVQEAARYYLSVREWEEAQRALAIAGRNLGLRNEEDVDALIHDLR